MAKAPSYDAGLAEACERLGDRWSLPIVATLLDGPLRYGEIQDRLPALAPNILSARLRKLERDGVLLAARYSARPARFDYRLTADGAALGGTIELLGAWAAARNDPAVAPMHEACGSALELRWWCPTCAAPVDGRSEEPILA